MEKISEQEFINYIKSDPNRLASFQNKTNEEKMSLYNQFVGNETEVTPLFKTTEVDEDKRKVSLGGATMLGADPIVTSQELAIAGLQGLNSFGYNLPEYAIKKLFNKEIPEPNTNIGKALELGGQVAGYATSPISGAIRKGVAAMLSPVLPEVTSVGTGIGSGALKGALEGSIAGFAITPEDSFLDITTRKTQAAGGAALGTIIGSVIGAKQGYTAFKEKFLSGGLEENLRQEKITSQERIEKIKSKQQGVQKAEDRLLKSLDKKTKQIESNLKENLTQAADKDALDIQKIVVKMKGSMSKNYESSLKNIEDSIIKNKGGRITNQELVDVLNRTMSESQAMQLDNGSVYQSIVKNAKNLNIEVSPSGLVDQSGNPIISFSASKPVDIPLRDAISIIRNITNNASSSLYASGRSAKSTDIPAMILREKWGDFISTLDPSGEFSKLNLEYKEASRNLRPVIALVKPYGSDKETKAIRGVIERVAKNPKLHPEDLRVLNTIENGVGSANPGGPVAQRARATQNLADIELKKLENKRGSYSLLSRQKQADLDKQIISELERMKIKETTIRKLMREEKFKSIISAVTGIGTSLGTAIPYAIKRYQAGKILGVLQGGQSSGGQ